MATSTRNLLMGVGFLVLVGLFLLAQRQPTNATKAPADIVQETSPRIDAFDPQVSAPQLIKPTGSGVSMPGTNGLSGTTATQPGSAIALPQDASYANDATSSAVMGAPQAGGTVSVPREAPSQSNATVQQGGPAASVDPSAPITEMISLPPSGPGPGDGSYDMGSIAPEQGSIDSAMAPEAGSSGVMGDAPELLPVTHPGPSGEMPDNSGPLPPQ